MGVIALISIERMWEHYAWRKHSGGGRSSRRGGSIVRRRRRTIAALTDGQASDWRDHDDGCRSPRGLHLFESIRPVVPMFWRPILVRLRGHRRRDRDLLVRP